jgi:hypothetical protein
VVAHAVVESKRDFFAIGGAGDQPVNQTRQGHHVEAVAQQAQLPAELPDRNVFVADAVVHQDPRPAHGARTPQRVSRPE